MVEVKKDGFSVKPVLEAGKVAYGNKDWEVVVMRVSDLWRDVLKEGDKTKQNNMANNCVSVAAGRFGVSNISTPKVLVDSVEVDQKNQQLFMVRELVTQGLAHSLEEGTATQKFAIASGSENEVKKVIPNNMDVMARDVRNATVDLEVGLRVDELEYTMSTGPGTDSQNADAIKTVVDDIKKWIKDNKVKKDDPRRGGIDRVVSMLAQRENELRGVVDSGKGKNVGEASPETEYLKDLAEYQKNQGELQEAVRSVSLEEIQDAYVAIRAPRERSPQLWEYKVPEFMGGMSQKEWRQLLSYQDGWLQAIYTKRNDNMYNNMIDKMKDGILGMKGLSEEDLKKWYENKTINLRGVMNHIVKELLVPKKVTSEIDGVAITRTVYVFDTEDGVNGKPQYVAGSRVEEFANNDVNYKMGLAERLAKKKVVANIQVAKLAVALAMDMMEMGGVFTEADTLRKLSWEADVVRLAQRPETKFTSKVGGGELFAGSWTEYGNSITHSDPKRSLATIESLGVVPKLLAGSFLDQKLFLAGGTTTSETMMKMIYDDIKIPFRDLGNDLYFGWRKDHILPAARMWMYIANKTPLSFSKNAEDDMLVSKWRVDLYNDINQLRKNGDALLPTTVVAGAIGGSIGIWPFEGPYLRVSGSAVHGDVVIDNFEAVTEIIRQLGIKPAESEEILRFFGVDNKNYRDLNHKTIAYTAIRNVTLPRFYRNNAEKKMLTKRSQ